MTTTIVTTSPINIDVVKLKKELEAIPGVIVEEIRAGNTSVNTEVDLQGTVTGTTLSTAQSVLDSHVDTKLESARIVKWEFTDSGDFIPLQNNSLNIGSPTNVVDKIYVSNVIGASVAIGVQANDNPISWRNASNTLDIDVIKVDTKDDTIINADSGKNIFFTIGGVDKWNIEGLGDFVPLGASGTLNIGSSSQHVNTLYVDNIVGVSIGSLNWVEVTADQTIVNDQGYICNSASLITLTLPSTAPIGSIIAVTSSNSGGWKINQLAGQSIQFGSTTTTVGVGGSLSSNQIGDTIHLVCVQADTKWNVINSIGNITVL